VLADHGDCSHNEKGLVIFSISVVYVFYVRVCSKILMAGMASNRAKARSAFRPKRSLPRGVFETSCDTHGRMKS
jgi:hypothetical protein